MIQLLAAFNKAGRDLLSPGMLWQALWPPLGSIVLWLMLGTLGWSYGIALLGRIVPVLPWSGWEWLSQWAAVFLLLAALTMLIYVTTVMLVALVVLPNIISRIAARDYAELMPHGENVFSGSLATTLGATALFITGALLTLPLLLIPGAIFFIPLAWTAWLNQRTFRFDALAEHATRSELQQLVRQHRTEFYGAGTGCALLAHVPLLNLLVPVFTALVFVHLGLMLLRQLRRQQGVQL
jgi:uncharacterized protein involved in cysteine biosynthesis